MSHALQGGGTARRQVFVWFQANTSGEYPGFPTNKELTWPYSQTVIRDALDQPNDPDTPSYLNSDMVWREPHTPKPEFPCPETKAGQPRREGMIKWGDLKSCPEADQGCQGTLDQEEGRWSVLKTPQTSSELALFVNTDRTRPQIVGRPLRQFTRDFIGRGYCVYSVDGIAPTLRAHGAYPPGSGCLVYHYGGDGVQAGVRRLSMREIWCLQQLSIEDLQSLQLLTFGPNQDRSDILHRIAGNAVPGSMANHVAELTRQRILQLNTGTEGIMRTLVNITYTKDDTDEYDEEYGQEWDSEVDQPNEKDRTGDSQGAGTADNQSCQEASESTLMLDEDSRQLDQKGGTHTIPLQPTTEESYMNKREPVVTACHSEEADCPGTTHSMTAVYSHLESGKG